MFADSNIINKTGQICMCAEIAQEYGFKDIDGECWSWNFPQNNFYLKAEISCDKFDYCWWYQRKYNTHVVCHAIIFIASELLLLSI